MNVYVDADGEFWLEEDGNLVPLTEGGEPAGPGPWSRCSLAEAETSYGPLTKLVRET